MQVTFSKLSISDTIPVTLLYAYLTLITALFVKFHMEAVISPGRLTIRYLHKTFSGALKLCFTVHILR